MGVKWLGNSGTHDEDDLPFEDLMSGYEIVEHALSELFDKPANKTAALARRLTKKHRRR